MKQENTLILRTAPLPSMVWLEAQNGAKISLSGYLSMPWHTSMSTYLSQALDGPQAAHPRWRTSLSELLLMFPILPFKERPSGMREKMRGLLLRLKDLLQPI